MTTKSEFMPPKNQKRLLRDVAKMIKNPLTDNGIYYVHDSDNMLKGYALIFGPDDSLYRYGAYMFEFKYPTQYPFVPPKVTYLTNDGKTRFNPNLYRNGKVCISLLNTWKGEQWTSCQTIKSVLLMLVTLLHNKPLLNEPGIKETHHAFKPYNKIITYKNLDIAILKTLKKKKEDKLFTHMGHCKVFYSIYEHYIKKNKDNILNYIKELKNKNKKQEIKVSVYNMNCLIDYENLEKQFIEIFNNIFGN